MTNAPSDPSGATRALADFAFGSQTRVADTSRPLAWLSPEEMDIDLADPVQRRFGDYELVEKIGQGGMGVVYRARQHGLERDVAIKLLAAGPWASEEFVARFRREARSAARMQHPNIVEIYEFGHRDGLNYFSMRLIDGQTLAQRIVDKGPLPPLEAARLLRTLAEAMDYAHRLGVLHLDLKPANVLLTQSGEPLIADFGLARRIDAGHEGGTEISGTPSYMAPEQAQLESHPLTASTDIYGLGAILYEVLTGRPPFTAPDVQETLLRVIAAIPKPPRQLNSSLPPDLEAICLKCLEKQPDDRYATARELADDLGNFLANRPVTVRVPGLWERTQRWWESHKTEVAMFALLLAGIAATTKEWLRADRALAEARLHQAAAQKQSTRSGQLAQLIAQAFPVPKDAATSDALNEAAARIVGWTHENLQGQPDEQQALVLGLVDSLDRADNPGAAQALMHPVVTRLGRDFLIAAAEAHIGSGTPRSRMLGALLLQGDGMGEANRARQQALLAEAMLAAPADRDILSAATYYCSAEASPCRDLNPSRRLAALDPDDAAAWIFAMRSDDDAATTAELLARAAAASRLDDRFNRVMALVLEAIETSTVPMPPLLASLGQRLAPEATPAEVVAHLHAYAMPIPSWGVLSNACRPDLPALRDASRREHCLRAGRLAAFQGQSLITSMVGSTIVRHMRPGAEEEARARELRRHYVYVIRMRDGRSAAQIRASQDGLLGREMSQFSEIEAFKRSLDRAGIPRDPPVDWLPDSPEQLMTGMERQVFRERQAEIARQDLIPDATD